MKKQYLLSLIASLAILVMLLPMSSVAGASGTVTGLTPQTPLDVAPIASTIQFVQPLPKLDVAGGTIQTIVAGTSQIELDMKELQANMLPSTFVPETGTYDGTWVWGYVKPGTNTSVTRDTYSGPVIVATRNVPTQVKWVNDLGTTVLGQPNTTNVLAYLYSTDQSLHWANPSMVNRYASDSYPLAGTPDHYSGAIPAAVHLHGAEDPAAVDGGPDSWFLSDGSKVGPGFYSKGWNGTTPQNYAIYRYPNVQEAAPLWFHAHTLGATRLNVYMGLAGGYLLADPKLKLPAGLNATGLRGGALGPNPADDAIIPLVVQDRMFDTNGQLYIPTGATTPDHAYGDPEFFGNTICVNGKVWPYLDVKAQRYEFLMINGSNARTYVLSFKDNGTTTVNGAHPTIWQVATDQGYLDKPVAVDQLVIMPGERAQFIIDFSGVTPGTSIVLNNFGPDVPLNVFPVRSADLADPATTGRVMEFKVVSGAAAKDTSFNPAAAGATIRTGGDAIIRLVDPTTGTLAKKVNPDLTRALTLNDFGSVTGVMDILVNNTRWTGTQPDPNNPNMMGPADQSSWTSDGIGNFLSELPKEGATEVWEIINMTPDSHPIHTHLAAFQVLNRQSFQGNLDKIIANQTDYVGAGGYFEAYADGLHGRLEAGIWTSACLHPSG